MTKTVLAFVALAVALTVAVYAVLTALAIGTTLHNVGRLLFEWRH